MIYRMITHCTLLLLFSTYIYSSPYKHTRSGEVNKVSSSFNPKAFMTDIRNTAAIRKAIKDGYLNLLIEEPLFVENIRSWSDKLMRYVIDRAISDGNLGALTVILNSKVRVDLLEFIIKAANMGRMDMVAELAQYGDPTALNEAFRIVTNHAEGAEYLDLLLQKTKGAAFSDAYFLNYAELAAFNGNLELLKIFLRNMDYANGKFSRAQLSKIYSMQITDDIFPFKVLERLRIRTSNSEVVKLVNAQIVSLLEKEDFDTISYIIEHLGWLSRSEFFQSLAKIQKWNLILNLSFDFPEDVGSTIVNVPASPTRVKLLKSFLKRLKWHPKKNEHLHNIFREVAEAGDINLIQTFFGKDQLWNISTTILPLELSDHTNEYLYEIYNNPPFWMLVNGILGAEKKKKEAMMNFLISKMDDVAAFHNTLLVTAVISARSVLVRTLLQNEQVVNSGLDSAIEEAQWMANYEILEMLERTKAMKPDFNYASGAA